MSPALWHSIALSMLLAATKVGMEIASIHLVFSYVLADALVVRSTPPLVPGKAAAYLLGIPMLSEQQFHASSGLFEDRVCVTVAHGIRKPLGLPEVITAAAAIAPQFPADAWICALQGVVRSGFGYDLFFAGCKPGIFVPL